MLEVGGVKDGDASSFDGQGNERDEKKDKKYGFGFHIFPFWLASPALFIDAICVYF